MKTKNSVITPSQCGQPFKVDLIPVSEEVYQSIYPEIERTCKRMQRNGSCVCLKSNSGHAMDCSVCPYSACGNTATTIPLDDAESDLVTPSFPTNLTGGHRYKYPARSPLRRA